MVPKQHLLLLIFLLYSSVFSCHQICTHQDQSALLAFSANISSPPPSLPLNWSYRVSCCQWEGIKCDLNGRVTHLILPSRSIEGAMLFSSISNLAMLTHLNFSNNNLHGSLGEDLTRLTNLRIIDLSANNFVGSIAQEIGKLVYLKKLHLYDNDLSGPIPPSLMNCTRIVEIILRNNRLDGEISRLDFSKLVKLQKLDLKTNSLNGTLPESIYSCKSLVAIRVSDNFLTGQISSKIGELKSLSFLSLAGNNFSNITMTLRVLAQCENLTTLSLSSNFLGESLPINKNFITSNEFSKLQFFSLAHCNFKPSPIPIWLSTLKSLRFLTLTNNRFTGRVPSWLGTLPKLFALGLVDNRLSGEIPLQLWQLPSLITENAQADLNFSEFELPVFYGSLPASRKSKTSMPTINSIRFKANYYRGIYLSNNSFHGHIPDEIGNLRNIQLLFLDNNRFSGHVPSSISNLHKLENLVLSTNNLTGEIPTSLASLSFLSYFDVSYNDLVGPIPSGGQFGSFEAYEFEGNPGLCGKPLNRSCYTTPPTSKVKNKNGSHDGKKHFLDGLFVGLASGFSSILVVSATYFWYQISKVCRRQ